MSVYMPARRPICLCVLSSVAINTPSCQRLNNEWDIDTDQQPRAASFPLAAWRGAGAERDGEEQERETRGEERRGAERRRRRSSQQSGWQQETHTVKPLTPAAHMRSSRRATRLTWGCPLKVLLSRFYKCKCLY